MCESHRERERERERESSSERGTENDSVREVETKTECKYMFE